MKRPGPGARLAAIDVGSNSIRLLVAEYDPATGLAPIDEIKDQPRLAQGLAATGRLDPAAMERALTALRRMADVCRRRGATSIAAVATAAVREAKNGDEFVRRVRDELGLPLQVISTEHEAQLSWRSVRHHFRLDNTQVHHRRHRRRQPRAGRRGGRAGGDEPVPPLRRGPAHRAVPPRQAGRPPRGRRAPQAPGQAPHAPAAEAGVDGRADHRLGRDVHQPRPDGGGAAGRRSRRAGARHRGVGRGSGAPARVAVHPHGAPAPERAGPEPRAGRHHPRGAHRHRVGARAPRRGQRHRQRVRTAGGTALGDGRRLGRHGAGSGPDAARPGVRRPLPHRPAARRAGPAAGAVALRPDRRGRRVHAPRSATSSRPRASCTTSASS